jgi:hypothetical protein
MEMKVVLGIGGRQQKMLQNLLNAKLQHGFFLIFKRDKLLCVYASPTKL